MWQWLMLCVVGVTLFQSCRQTDMLYLRGRVYDGMTGQPVATYTVAVELTNGETLNAKITNGSYAVGPIPPWQDYTVRITADGYRPFYDNIAANVTTVAQGNAARDLTAYREAYVFPTNVQTPQTTVRIMLQNSQMPASGFIRLRPTAGGPLTGTSALDLNALGLGAATPTAGGGGIGQVPALVNQADAQQATVVKDFTGGVVTFDAGQLVYGVSYTIDVFGVAGYQLQENGVNGVTGQVFIAGITDTFFVVLTPITDAPNFRVVFLNTANDSIIPNGSLVVGFSEPIELDPAFPKATREEILDGNIGVRISATNAAVTTQTCTPPAVAPGPSPQPASANVCNPDGDMNDTVLAVNDTANNHGVSITLDATGMTMTIAWNEGSSFLRRDAGAEVLTGVIWTGLDQICVRRQKRPGGVGTPESFNLTGTGANCGGGAPGAIGAMLGATVTVRTAAQPAPAP